LALCRRLPLKNASLYFPKTRLLRGHTGQRSMSEFSAEYQFTEAE
jgi:hypothetical protein